MSHHVGSTSVGAPPRGRVVSVPSEQMFEYAQTVWTTILGVPLSASPSPDPGAERFHGRVHISGAWEGTVVLECSGAFARWAASRMFESNDTTFDEVRDALGELTNMVGGNIKALLPGPSRLSIPEVASGEKVEEERVLHVLELDCQGEPVVLKLLAPKGSVSLEGK